MYSVGYADIIIEVGWRKLKITCHTNGLSSRCVMTVLGIRVHSNACGICLRYYGIPGAECHLRVI